jgi:hypothetical protein
LVRPPSERAVEIYEWLASVPEVRQRLRANEAVHYEMLDYARRFAVREMEEQQA